MKTLGLFQSFASGVMERAGALVEDLYPDGLSVCLPLELQAEWRSDEMLALGFGETLPPGAQRVSLEGEWFERFTALLGGAGSGLRLTIAAPDQTPSGIDRMLERQIQLGNGVYRMIGTADRAWTRYLIVSFRCTAISDEKRETLIRFGVNLRQGSLISAFVDQLFELAVNTDNPATVRPAIRDLPPDWPLTRLESQVRQVLPRMIEAYFATFLGGMQRRLDRDLARVFDYYDGLSREAHARLRRKRGEAAIEQLRIEAAQREYHAKVADLRQKYALRVTVEVSQILELVMPVSRVEILLKRRKKERRLSLDWNPLTRQLDSLPCDWGWSADPARLLCDDALHLVEAGGLAPCADCGREYCRACHPRQCPRCRLSPGE